MYKKRGVTRSDNYNAPPGSSLFANCASTRFCLKLESNKKSYGFVKHFTHLVSNKFYLKWQEKIFSRPLEMFQQSTTERNHLT